MDNNGGFKLNMQVPDLSKVTQNRVGVVVNVLASEAINPQEQLTRARDVEIAKQQIAEVMMKNRIFRVDAFLAIQ